MDSLSNKGNVRGITLNNQLIDLFNLIDTAESREEASNSVIKYLYDILQANELSKEMDKQGLNRQQRIKKVVQEKVENIENKEEFLKFLLENAMEINANWESRENLESFLEGKEIDSSYIDAILNMKKYFTYQNHGILTCLVDENGKTINPDERNINIDREKTFQKVEALYEYVTGKLENGENRFNRITLDGQGNAHLGRQKENTLLVTDSVFRLKYAGLPSEHYQANYGGYNYVYDNGTDVLITCNNNDTVYRYNNLYHKLERVYVMDYHDYKITLYYCKKYSGRDFSEKRLQNNYYYFIGEYLETTTHQAFFLRNDYLRLQNIVYRDKRTGSLMGGSEAH